MTAPREDVSRCDEYRDLLEHWAKWWDGPGRENYPADFLLPPLEKTREALTCLACAGESLNGERCAACGRGGR